MYAVEWPALGEAKVVGALRPRIVRSVPLSKDDHITWSSSHEAAVVHLNGEFDLADVEHLQDSCRAAITALGPRVVIDLSETRFLDSSALGALIGVANEAHARGGWLHFASAQSPGVQRLFDITMVDEVLGLFGTVQEAADHH